ncbi:MAG: DUF1080 domain-containing protein [Parabacteroides sp.]|nr:DUF1080 domain-containing protein [Parabacteroides sp.]
MKFIYSTLIAMFFSVAALSAQTQRTVKTTVADVLAQMDNLRRGESGKLMADLAAAYGKALQTVTGTAAKAFFITRLQQIGSSESVPMLRKYLSDPALCANTAAALGAIGGTEAGNALLEALPASEGTCREALLDAVAATEVPGAEKALLALTETNAVETDKALARALGRCGSDASLDWLAGKAKHAGYAWEPGGITASYVALLKRTGEQGNAARVAKDASALLKNAAKAGEMQTRAAALEVLFSVKKGEEAALLLAALNDPDRAFRQAALQGASGIREAEAYKEIIKRLPKFKPEVKADVLNWIASQGAQPEVARTIRTLEIKYELPALLVLQNQLKDTDFEVKKAAAWALVKVRDRGAVPLLVGLLGSDDAGLTALGQATLEAFDDDVSTQVARAVPSLPNRGKIAALEILALRKANDNVNTVYNLVASSDKEVKIAALRALKEVVTGKELIRLFGMLQQAPTEDVPAIQEAIAAALAGRSPREQLNTIIEQMYRAGDSKKYLFYPLLARTGEAKALEIILSGFRTGTGVTKEAAFAALTRFEGTGALDELLAIGAGSPDAAVSAQALDAYVHQVAVSGMTAENRLIFLRKAMEVTRNDAQRIPVLQEIAKTGSFQALLYAGSFLEDNALQQVAAHAVIDIALAHPEYAGPDIKRLLERAAAVVTGPDAAAKRQAVAAWLEEAPAGGFVSMFNGRDLTGWKGLVGTPLTRARMSAAQLVKAQAKADETARRDWKVENGCLVFEGDGFDNLCTEKPYGDFEMYVDWRLDPAGPEADAGIYLRGTPQVQIWDTARVKVGAQVGSGGLYNNRVNPSKPLKVADNRLGEWNTFFIRMVGDRVTVYLNGELVTDNVILENYWDAALPVPPVEQIELQAHGSKVYYRNLYIRELERPEPFRLPAEEEKAGFRVLFDGTNMHEWTGNTRDYVLENGCIVMHPTQSFGGNLYTKNEFADFIYRFEFCLTPAANNGVGIRTPMEGDAAYVGMEVQILDCEHPVYKDITPLQHHGSVYGILPAMEHACNPVGEWNTEEIMACGDRIRVTVNGVVVVDGNIREAVKNGTPDGQEHPGLFNKKGHIGFLGHGSEVKFRNIRIKELK